MPTAQVPGSDENRSRSLADSRRELGTLAALLLSACLLWNCWYFLWAFQCFGCSGGRTQGTIEIPAPPIPFLVSVGVLIFSYLVFVRPRLTVTPISAATMQVAGARADFVWKINGEPNPFSKVNGPIGVAVDVEGNLFVVDAGNSRVQKFDRDGKFLLMWGSKGASDGQFNITTPDEGRAAVDGEGNVYVADVNNYRVQKFDPNGKFLTKWGSEGNGDGQFREISDIAIDQHNDVYIVDYRENAVQKFNCKGGFLLRWGSPGTLDGELNGPFALAIDTQENVLVAELDPGRLQKFDGNGKFLSKYLLPPVANRVVQPWCIALDGQGYLYIADHSACRVVKLDSSGNLLAVWGSEGTDEGQFYGIQDIALDREGNVYVTDSTNICVQKFRQSSVGT